MKRQLLLDSQLPTDTPYIEIGGVKWATTSLITDVRTGKNYFADLPETLGSMFQWGRRYGAPSSVTTCQTGKLSIAQGEDLNNASKLIGNPYSSNPGPYQYSWCSEIGTSAYSKLWTSSKGEYDPCPDGWRVPTREELTSLTNAAYRQRGYRNGIEGWTLGDNDRQTIFIPYQPNMSWGVPNLDPAFVSVLSCTLGNNQTHYILDIGKTYERFNVQTSFQSTGGIIRAVKM